MLKRWIFCILLICLLFSIAGCGAQKEAAGNNIDGNYYLTEEGNASNGAANLARIDSAKIPPTCAPKGTPLEVVLRTPASRGEALPHT